MKKFLKIIVAFALSLGIISGVTITPQGINTTPQNVAYAKKAPKVSIKIIKSHLTVKRGQYASFTIKTKKKTKTHAMVFYKSGKSKSKSLGYKKTNSKGITSWRWKVGTRTTKGTWKVYVYVGSTHKVLKLHVK